MSVHIKIKGGYAILDDETINCYIRDFPEIDVMNEIAAIKSYMDCNPQKLKATCSGVKKFTWCWLRNIQNSKQLKIKL